MLSMFVSYGLKRLSVAPRILREPSPWPGRSPTARFISFKMSGGKSMITSPEPSPGSWHLTVVRADWVMMGSQLVHQCHATPTGSFKGDLSTERRWGQTWHKCRKHLSNRLGHQFKQGLNSRRRIPVRSRYGSKIGIRFTSHSPTCSPASDTWKQKQMTLRIDEVALSGLFAACVKLYCAKRNALFDETPACVKL